MKSIILPINIHTHTKSILKSQMSQPTYMIPSLNFYRSTKYSKNKGKLLNLCRFCANDPLQEGLSRFLCPSERT